MKIAFVHNSLATFVERDLRILRERYEVEEVCCRGLTSLPGLFAAIFRCDMSFTWFASIHAFWTVLFSKILGKKAVIVSGGYDAACVPELKYGLCCRWWKRWCPKFIFRLADLVFCVSKYNMRETLTNARAPRTKTSLLYNAVETERFFPSDCPKRTEVVTVAGITNITYHKKGLSLFVQSARLLPEIEFLLVGPEKDSAGERLREEAPSNVLFVGARYGDELSSILQDAKVYVQASVHESFGVAVAEAMLCGCVPVVSRRAALPEVVGDCGFYLEDLTPEEVAAKIRLALGSNLGAAARRRIIDHFPFEKRSDSLLAGIERLRRKPRALRRGGGLTRGATLTPAD